MRSEWKSPEISNSVELDPGARLTNNINSSRKLKVTWLILGRSHARSSFQLCTATILAQKATCAYRGSGGAP